MSTTDTPPAPAPPPLSTAASDFSIDTAERTLRSSVDDYFARIRGGELGSLPAILGFVVLFILFSITADNFLTARNFANLLTQATPVILIAIGLTLVLLLGEIDLSAGATAGVCAVYMASWLNKGVNPWIAIPGSVLIGVAIGLLTGWLVARVGIPSFVVTLAFFLSWQGVVLIVAKEGGTIAVTNSAILAIATKNMKPVLGWVLWAIVVVGYLASAIWQRRTRTRVGLSGEPLGLIVIKATCLAVGWGVVTYFLNKNRAFAGTKTLEGVPIAVPFVLFFVVLLSLALGRTPWGRHLYAVGGNAEASRRAGINVRRIRMSGFVVCSSMAAVGGMALASQLSSVSPQTGGNDTVLLAVAAAVIGGTSLFGGHGKISNAVVGGLVVAMIPNGLGLLGTKTPFGFTVNFSDAGTKFVITGMVLLLAASVDALSRKRAQATGV